LLVLAADFCIKITKSLSGSAFVGVDSCSEITKSLVYALFKSIEPRRDRP
jgi:hypothetical protein